MANQETIQQKVLRLEAENAAMATRLAARSHLALKVSEKGAVSLYGIRRFPVTFYKSEWERIIGHVDQVKAFIEVNAASLSVKGD